MEDKKKELRTKKRFFRGMYSLDYSETDDEDLDKVPLTLEELREKSLSRIPAHRRGRLQSRLAADWEKLSSPVASPRVLVPRSFLAEDQLEKEDEDPTVNASSVQNSRKKSTQVIPTHLRPRVESHFIRGFGQTCPTVMVPHSGAVYDGFDTEDEISTQLSGKVQASKKRIVLATALEGNSQHESPKEKPVSVIPSSHRPRAESCWAAGISRTLLSPRSLPRVLVPHSGAIVIDDDSSTASEIEEKIHQNVPIMKSTTKLISAITPEQKVQLASRMPTDMGRTLSSPLPVIKMPVPRSDVLVIEDASTTEDELPTEAALKARTTKKRAWSAITPHPRASHGSPRKKPLTRSHLMTDMGRIVSAPLHLPKLLVPQSGIVTVDSETEDKNPNEAILGTKALKDKTVAPITPYHKLHDDSCMPAVMARTLSSPLPLPNGVVSRLSATEIDEENPIATVTRLSSNLSPNSKLRNLPRTSLPCKDAEIAKAKRAASRAAAKVALKEARKRARGQPEQFMPVSQQVFKGKVFYFLPNSAICRARCSRIRRAQEYGATWIQEWRDSITHVIVDMRLTYADVLKYLKFTSWPQNVVLVNETYPSDCINYRSMADPSQEKYQVQGQQEITVVPQTPTSTGPSPQLKPRKRQAPTETPPRREGKAEIAAGQELELLGRKYEERCKQEAKRLQSKEAPKDDLDKAIQEVKEVEGLPLDTLDEDDLSVSVSYGYESDEEPSRRLRKPSLASEQGVSKVSWQTNFSCMQKHDGLNKKDNPNFRTIEILQKMADYYDRTRDKWRWVAYRKAIGCLSIQTTQIISKEQALALPHIGVRLADKIEEIVWTSRLRCLDNTMNEPEDVAFQLFLGIYGVGFAQAKLWVSQGYRTLKSLSQSASLTDNQRIGVEHYEDFQKRIPRSEVTAHAALLRDHILAVSADLELTVGGSYRRGAPHCGDIDFLLTSPTIPITALRSLFLNELLPRLAAIRYLRAGLAETDPIKGTKWHGAACLPSAKAQIWRRIDFLLVPYEEWGAALIYFTGNDIFNRSMRLLASKKGMRLNQKGLFKDVMRGPGRKKITDGTLVEGKSEKLIFQHLGVPWRPPAHRIC